jgi:citrate lyase subunit alpha/citrate CoA-transferase
VASLVRGNLPIVTDEVLTATTPGESVDVVVIDHGVAVNPRRSDLEGRLMAAGLPVTDISGLRKAADKAAGTPRPAVVGDKFVAVVEYRDGTPVDVVRHVAI